MDKVINEYGKLLNGIDISEKHHRGFVGGMWEEMGRLQIQFMLENGLNPKSKLLDIGCGALRGGIYFIRYLNKGNYFGLDINSSMIEAAKYELQHEGLNDKNSTLLVNDKFEFSLFESEFDFILAQSVFTHLPLNHILRCLIEVKKVLKKDGVFYVTFFKAKLNNFLDSIEHPLGKVITNFDSNPYHYPFEFIEGISEKAGLNAEYIGNWNHPRNQKMIKITHQ